MSVREEFVQRVQEEETGISGLCREYGISRPTAYWWLERYTLGEEPTDRCRWPLSSPRRTRAEVEAVVVAVRQAHPAWDGRKIHSRLIALGHDDAVRSPSTITEILRRHGLIDPEEARKHRPWMRFEMEEPNQLWQMDFKGHLCLGDRTICHPPTVLDGYSRYLLGLAACRDQTRGTVQAQLTLVFKENGLPERMLMDHGSPWGCSRNASRA